MKCVWASYIRNWMHCAHLFFFLVVSRFVPYSNKTILYDLRLAADIIVIHLNVFLSQIANFLCNVRLKPLFLHLPQNTVHAHWVFRHLIFKLFDLVFFSYSFSCKICNWATPIANILYEDEIQFFFLSKTELCSNFLYTLWFLLFNE